MKEQLSTLDWRWRAVEAKNAEFDGAFYFAVRTTGVFCRPSCSSRTPKRKNVSFYLTPNEAERAGFRACMRCKPKDEYYPGVAAELILRAFEILSNEEIATVEDLSSMLNVTPGHLQKTFKSTIGVTPKEVLKNMRIEEFKRNVREMDVTTSLYESGFGSSRSLYEKAGESLGMTPATYKKGGPGIEIRYTIADSPLGKMLVAATSRGICAVSFGDDSESLKKELESEFFAASISMDDKGLKTAVASILKGLKGERAILSLPVDVRASAFQMRVWSELRRIPYGETRTYGQIAEEIGRPKAVRAVARACATNPVAIVTPCHRVIGSDGKLSGYRWGIERKKLILEKEGSK
ncbi:MAG TPA: bifunctional DNA-binding transcriptional regulator/O6-methylguanine-DNA methyltransferase Ada [Pyrinomonadaceae bacterium]|nr:bifunctional DNA-binding transcriptional regulator/O6-methylguanine-DNA methyltransferase Ada [Pyrinomonadaceae bacterium]